MDFFAKSVSMAMETDGFLEKFLSFLLRYCIHGAPKGETMKKLWLDLYFNDIELELSNKFPLFIEYNTTSGLAWQSWQYINTANIMIGTLRRAMNTYLDTIDCLFGCKSWVDT